MAWVAVGSAVAGAAVTGLLADGSSGGGGGGGGGGVSPGQDALARTQSDLQQYLMSRMKDKFAPLEDQFIADAAKAGTPDEIANKMGAAHGTAAQTQAAAERGTAEMLRRRGVSMTSPAALALQQDATIAGAANDASAQTAARDAEINRGLALKQAAIGIGRGLDSTAATLGNSASNILSAGANQANAAYLRQRQSNMDAGYAVAPIAKAVSSGVSGWIKNNTGVGGYGYGAVDGGSGGYAGSQWSDGPDAYDWGTFSGGGLRDGGIVHMVRNGVPGYKDGEIISRAGLDAQAQADMQVRGARPVSAPAPAPGTTMTQTQFSNAGGGRPPMSDAERAAKLREAERNRPPPKRMAEGGIIDGPGGPTDDAIPAMVDGQQPIAVSDGEAVLNEKATNAVLGAPLVHIINALGVLRRTVEGGMPSASMARG